MKTHHLSSVRDQIGNLIQDNKPIILVEILGIALFPLLLAFLQIPNTILPLFLIGWLSLWLRHQGWRDVGFRRPASRLRVILIGSGIALAGVYISEKAISPVLLRLLGETQPQAGGLAIFRDILLGNVFYLLLFLFGIWLLAAIGEELVYRGYVLNRLVDLVGRSKVGWAIALMVSSLLFSLGHGIFDWAVIIGGFLLGLLEGGLYLISRQNLWLPIIFHGTWDTIFLILFFLGVSWRGT